MGVKKRRIKAQKPSPDSTGGGLEVESLPRFLQRCGASIGRLLNLRPHWVLADATLKEVRYLSAARATRADSKDRQIPVLPYVIDRSGIPTHWIAVAFTSNSETNRTVLTHGSLQVYKGEASDPKKQLLFRAEWDAAQMAKLRHAQPHWHFHRERGEDAPPLDLPLQQLREVEDVQRHGEWIYRHVHFPMASRFHEGEDRCVVPSSEDHLREWATRTISYVRDELQGLFNLPHAV